MATSATIKNPDQLPEYAKSTARQIEDLGFKWELDYEYPVPHPDKTQRVQIRNVTHIAPPTEVTKYKEAMKRGDKFPPGVVTKDGRFVDFNTRAMAAHKLGWPTFPAFVINVDYGNSTEAERERVRLLGAAFNTKGPKPLSREEIVDIVETVAGNPDWTAARVAQHLGVSQGTTNSVFAQVKARRRAEKLGVHLNGSVSATNVAALGQRSDKLTDRPFREVARLAQDAGLEVRELRDLLKKVEEVTGSDEEKITVIEAERAARETQIAHFKATGKAKPPLSVELRRRLVFILEHQNDPGAMAEYNPATAAEHLRKIIETIEILELVRDAQESLPAQEALPAEGMN
jgi:AraC-like DNA-binding protein